MNRTVAIIQARMGSTRLPGKVLLPLCGHSVLAHVITRALAVPEIDAVVVATSTLAADDAVAAEAARYRAMVCRGPEDDVLERYRLAAAEAAADTVIRITSDCPLLDPAVVGAMLTHFLQQRGAGRALDYLSNGLQRSFPRGLDAEIFTRAVLERCAREAWEPHMREHVTPYVYQHPDRFRIEAWTQPLDQSAQRWTLDTPEDWALISAIFGALGDGLNVFPSASVHALLDAHPDWRALNAHIEQKPLPAAAA